MIFWYKFAQEGISGRGDKKNENHHLLEVAFAPNFSLNWEFLFFGPDLSKRVFPV